ncbi:MAG: hypothetical protein IT330_18380 [Anaerolineae bacterium]|nr:hypothetical protein [Anaerolineae bacterium]
MRARHIAGAVVLVGALWALWLVLPGRASPSAGGTIRGAIAYTGTVTGTHLVYVYATTMEGPPVAGTAIPAPGPYELDNVPDGDYIVGAYLDADDSGGPPTQGVDPMGRYPVTVTITGSNVVTGVNIVLTDPARGAISGQVSYRGAISGTHNIVVIVWQEGTSGPPEYATVRSGPGPYNITGVADGRYQVAAFMDRDGDMGSPEPDEPFAWYPATVVVSSSPISGINVALYDPYRRFLPLAVKR